MIGILHSTNSDHNIITLEFSDNSIFREKNVWKLYNILQNNNWVKYKLKYIVGNILN